MQRLIIVHSSHSTKAAKVRDEVILPAQRMPGLMVGKFEVYGKSVAENAEGLSKVLRDGDIVLTAGGDGTTEVGVNGILRSKKDVRLGILGYGNFNDVARAFGFIKFNDIFHGKTVEVFPLECFVNGKHLQYAMGYFTAGMMADAARMLNRGGRRERLQKNKNNILYTINQAVKWYFKNRKNSFLPGLFYKEKYVGDMTEYMAVNVGTMARILKTKTSLENRVEFVSGVRNLKNFWKMTGFGIRGVLLGIKLQETRGDELTFKEPTRMVIQSEGECMELKNVQELTVRKSERSVKVFKI